MTPNYSKFTLDYTNMLKGIALMLLLCNHFCVVQDWITSPSTLVDINIQGKPLLGYLGAFGKICVAIWAFLSGIGAYYSYRNGILSAYKSNLVRLANLMIQYVLILAIVFVPVIALCHPTFMGESYKLDLKHIIYNIFACDAEYDKAAWYMRFYIMYVLSFPVLMFVKRKVNKDLLFYIGTFCIFILASKVLAFSFENMMVGTVPLKQILGEYCSYMLIAVSGYIVAEYSLFERFQKKIGRKANIGCSVMFLLVAMALRSYSKSINLGVISIYTDIVITPFVVYAFFVFFQNAFSNIKRTFVYLGKTSMVVWLVHWIFNVGVPQIQMIAYLPKISYLVILWVLIMCLGFNYVFTSLVKKFNILIKINK